MPYGFDLFPVLQGQGWPNRKQEQSTIVQRSDSGREVRIAQYLQAYYNWEIPFGYLNDDINVATADFQIIMGFHELNYGKWQPFLYDCPNDNDTSQYQAPGTTPSDIGVGDGTTTTFQLSRTMGGAPHLVYYVNTTNRAAVIYLNGVVQGGGYTISTTGLVTFTTAPGAGVVVSADFQYYFLVRFDDDSIESETVAGSFEIIKSVTLYETFQ